MHPAIKIPIPVCRSRFLETPFRWKWVCPAYYRICRPSWNRW